MMTMATRTDLTDTAREARSTLSELADAQSRLMHLAAKAIAIAVRETYPTATVYRPTPTGKLGALWSTEEGSVDYIAEDGTTVTVPVETSELNPELRAACQGGLLYARDNDCAAFTFDYETEPYLRPVALTIDLDRALALTVPSYDPLGKPFEERVWEAVYPHAVKAWAEGDGEGEMPEMVSITVVASEWENGYFFAGGPTVELADGNELHLGEYDMADDFADDYNRLVGCIGEGYVIRVERTADGLQVAGEGW